MWASPDCRGCNQKGVIHKIKHVGASQMRVMASCKCTVRRYEKAKQLYKDSLNKTVSWVPTEDKRFLVFEIGGFVFAQFSPQETLRDSPSDAKIPVNTI